MTPRQEADIRSAFETLAQVLIDVLEASERDHSRPSLLSMTDAAKTLGISRATLYAEIGAGRLRTRKIGQKRLVSTAAIADYIESPG